MTMQDHWARSAGCPTPTQPPHVLVHPPLLLISPMIFFLRYQQPSLGDSELGPVREPNQ
jgi:hypothetical protein